MSDLPPADRKSPQSILEALPRPVRLLTVIDGSERTGRILELALRLARNGLSIEAVILSVIAEPPDGRLRGYGSFKRKDIHARLKDLNGARAVAAAARRFEQAGIAHTDRVEVGDAVEIIVRVADDESCDMILLGDAPSGAVRRWLSKIANLAMVTVAGDVTQRATLPVVVIK